MVIVLTVNDKHFEHKLDENQLLKMAGTTSCGKKRKFLAKDREIERETV